MRQKEKKQRGERKEAKKEKPEKEKQLSKQTNQAGRVETRNKQADKPTASAVLGPRK